MNHQEVFNKVYVHLLTQNAPSLKGTAYSDPICAYRGENGLMCAVGCLISDEAYREYIEESPANGKNVLFENVLFVLQQSGIIVETEYDVNFLIGLQKIHDMTKPSDWGFHLSEFARIHILTIPEFTKETK